MTLHRGDTFVWKGREVIVKRIDQGEVTVEDEYGLAFVIDYEPTMVPRSQTGYTATVDSDGWVKSFEDTDA